MQSLSASWRLLRAIAHMFSGWWTIRFRFARLAPAEQAQCVQQWSERMLNLMGIRLTVHGTPPAHGPVLVVCNHLSWLDILAIHAARHVRFVSKASVRHWPVIGTLSTGAGTLYIERERRRDAVRVVHHMTEALRAGDIIAVFPEGTTSDGHGLLPFHANLLQAAIATQTPVQPVALRFSDANERVSQAAAYVGDTHLLRSLWSVVSASQMRACVTWLPATESRHADRRALANLLREQIGAALNVTD